MKVTVTAARTTAATGAAPATAPGPAVFRGASEWATILADKAKATPTADLVSANVKSGDKYQINIVRRTKPQGAIAHAVGTEIHEILDGTRDPRHRRHHHQTASGATGTATIQNGQTVKVSKGDVVLVPPNTPHWYQSIDGMVTYLEIRFDVGAPAGGPATVLTHTEQERVMAKR
jgi:mannose-6-phosphate isomerase-like protein (cupin superfamily)